VKIKIIGGANKLIIFVISIKDLNPTAMIRVAKNRNGCIK